MGQLRGFPDESTTAVPERTTSPAAPPLVRRPPAGVGGFPPDPLATQLAPGPDKPAPDVAARVLELQQRTGLTADTIARHKEEIEQLVATRALDDPQLFQRVHPKLAQWLMEDRNAAAAARGDLPSLRAVDHTLTFGERMLRGLDQLEMTVGGHLEFLGESLGAESLAAYGREVRERNKAEMEARGPGASLETAFRSPTDAANYIKAVVGEQIPMMAPSLAGGAAGTGLGALIGGPPGAVIGGAIGVFAPSFVLGTGEVQVGVKERSPEASAPLEVLAGGSMIAALDSWLPGKIGGRLVRTFGRETAEEVVKRTLAKPVAASFVRSTLNGTVSGMAVEGFTEALQEAIGEVAAATGTTTRVDVPELAWQALEAGAAGALMGGLAEGATAAGTHRREQARVAAAQQAEQVFADLAAGVAGAQHPQVVREFLQRATKDGPLEFMYIPVEPFRAHFESQGVNPELVARELTGSATALADADKARVDLQVRTAAYASILAGTDHHAALSPDLRLGANVFTANEAKELSKRLQAREVTPEGIQAAAEVDAGRQELVRRLQAQLSEVYTPEQARTFAEALAIRTEERARRLNVDPLTMLRDAPPDVTITGGAEVPTSIEIPASSAPAGERPEAYARRRAIHLAALASALTRDAQAQDPNVTPEQIRQELAFRLELEEERQGTEQESGAGQDLLRAIADYGGLWYEARSGAYKGEVEGLIESGRDIRGVAAGTGRVIHQPGRATYAGVAGVYREEGLTPDAMVEALRQDQRFQGITDINDLFDAIEQAQRTPSEKTSLPGTRELERLGIVMGTPWWSDSWSAPATEEADSFNPEEFEQSGFPPVPSFIERLGFRVPTPAQRLAELEASPTQAGARIPPFPRVAAATGERLWRAAGGFNTRTHVERVPLSKLVATQDWIFPDVVEEYAAGERTGATPPRAMGFAGRFYLADGTHRAAAAWAKGETTFEVQVMDVDVEKLEGGAAGELFELSPGTTPEGFHLVDPYLSEEEASKLRADTAQALVAAFKDTPRDADVKAAALAGKVNKGWYQRSFDAIVALFGPIDALRFSAVLAATSPVVTVQENLAIAAAVWTRWVKAGRPTGDEEAIVELLEQARIPKLIASKVKNAARALAPKDPFDIQLSGPKVASFTRNLWGYAYEVTLDAWMAKFALVDETIFGGELQASGDPGKGPRYLAHAAKYRRVAEQLTEETGEQWTPANVQETVWSWAKTVGELARFEKRNAVELVREGAITDRAIVEHAADFADLLTRDASVRDILEVSGYGPVLRAFDDTIARKSRRRGARASDERPRQARGIAPGLLRAAGRLEAARQVSLAEQEQRKADKLKAKQKAARAVARQRAVQRRRGELEQRAPRELSANQLIRQAQKQQGAGGLERVVPEKATVARFSEFIDTASQLMDQTGRRLERMRLGTTYGENHPERVRLELFYNELQRVIDRAYERREALKAEGGTQGELFQRPPKLRTTKYTSDLFGAPLPPGAGEFSVRTEMVVENERELGSQTVRDHQEAAAALAYLARGAQERFDAIVADANGTPLAVVGAFKGAVDQSLVHPGVIVAEAFRVQGATQIWFAHNHPSGSPTFSPDDLALAQRLQRAFLGSEITPRGFLAIAAGTKEYSALGLSGLSAGQVITGTAAPASSGVVVPVVERQLTETGTMGDMVSTSAEAFQVVQRIAQGRFGIALVNVKNAPIGFVPLDPMEAITLRQGGRLDALYRALAETAPAHAFVTAQDAANEPAALNVANALDNLGIAVLDVFTVRGGHPGALRPQGRPMPLTGEFYQAEATPARKPWAYSRLVRAVEASTLQKARGAQWKATIRQAKTGINKDEYLLAGVEDLANDTTYTRQEVLDYLEANRIQVETVTFEEGAGPDARAIEKRAEKIWEARVNEELARLEEDNEARGPIMLDVDVDIDVQQNADGDWYLSWKTNRAGFSIGTDADDYVYDTEEEAREAAQAEVEDRNTHEVKYWEEQLREQAANNVSYYQAEQDAEVQLREEAQIQEVRFPEHSLPGPKEPLSYREVFLTVPLVRGVVLDGLTVEEQQFLSSQGWSSHLSRIMQALGDGDELGAIEIVHSWAEALRLEAAVAQHEQAEAVVRIGERGGSTAAEVLRERALVAKLRDNLTWHHGPGQGFQWEDGHDLYDDVSNPIVRLRFDIRTLADGRRVMFLEEVQPPHKDEQAKMPPLFQSQWRELAMKWALAHASELGADGLAWTSGRQQLERNNLRRFVERLEYYPRSHQLAGYDKDGHEVIRKYEVTPEQLPNYLGTGLAERLLATANKVPTFEVRPKMVHRVGRGFPEGGANVQVWTVYGDIGVEGQMLDLGSTTVIGHQFPAYHLSQGTAERAAQKLREHWPRTLEGERLEVTNRGLERLYDVDLGSRLHNLPAVKRAGQRVQVGAVVTGEISLPVPARLLNDRTGAAAREWMAAHPPTPTTAPVHVLPITPELRFEVLGKGVPLFQDEGDQGDVKGGYTPAINLIRLVQGKADLSTFLHEASHGWLEELMTDASRSGVAQLEADAATVLKWFGFQGTPEEWLKLPIESRREQHEQWARGFEVYLHEGRAPSAELQPLFSKFRAWLTATYRRMLDLARGDLGKAFKAAFRVEEINPEVRGVMDRLLASDDAIAAVQAEANISPLFSDAASAGVEPLTFDAYRQAIEEANRAAREDVDRRLMADYRKEQQAWWKQERSVVEAAVREEMTREPAMVAQSVMRTGKLPNGQIPPFGDGRPLKFAKDDVVRAYGAETLKRLRMGRDYLYTLEGGLPVDTIAELTGFPSGQALLDALRRAPRLEHVVDAEADRRMRERHGDVMLEGMDLKSVAEGAVHEHRARVISAELDALTKGMTGTRLLRREQLAAQAKDAIGRTPIRELRPGKYLQAGLRASRRAFEAFSKNDREGAIAAKQDEQIAYAYHREARETLERAESRSRELRGYHEHPATRARLGRAGHDYIDQVDQILERYEFKPVPLKTIARRESLRAFVQKLQAQHLPVDIDEDVLDDARQINWRELTADELEGVYQTVEQLAHMARTKDKLLKLARNREVAQIANELDTSIRSSQPKRARPLEGAKRVAEQFSVAHLKIATLARAMDHFTEGPMFDYVVRPLGEAATRELSMKADATRAVLEIFDRFYSPAEQRAMYDRVHYPELGPVEKASASLSKMERVMVLLNLGNETNRQRVRDGHGWSEEQLGFIVDSLDRRDGEFATAVWQYFETFRPEMAAKEKRVKGIEPEWVEASPVFTRFGELPGGYFPIVFDTDLSARAASHEDATFAELIKAASYVSSVPRRNHLKRRAQGNVTRPVLLSFDVIFRHVDRVIHDLTHHEVLLDVGRLLDREEVSQAIVDTYGIDAYNNFKRTLRDIAIGSEPARDGVERILLGLRNGATTVGLAWNATTVMLQPLGLTQSWQRLGGKWVLRGFMRYLAPARGEQSTFDRIARESEFMRTRAFNINRELYDVANAIGLDRSGKLHPGTWLDVTLRAFSNNRVTRTAVAQTFFSLLQKMQYRVDAITYLAAEEKAMQDPGNLKEDGTIDLERVRAVSEQAVKDTQGAGSVMDLSPVQRNNALKLLTNFYSYFNVTYQQAWLSQRQARRRGISAKTVASLAGDYLLLFALPGALAPIIRDAMQGEDDPDEYLKDAVLGALAAPLGTMLLFREFAGVFTGALGYEGPPGLRAIAAGTKFMRDLGQAIVNLDVGEFTETGLRGLNTAAGALWHYPAGQVDKTVRGAIALAEGDTYNPLVLLTGPPPRRR